MLARQQNWWFGERGAFSFCAYHFSFHSSFFNVTHNKTKLISKHFNSILLITIMLSLMQNCWFGERKTFSFCVYHSSFPSSFFNVTHNITNPISKHFNLILFTSKCFSCSLTSFFNVIYYILYPFSFTFYISFNFFVLVISKF